MTSRNDARVPADAEPRRLGAPATMSPLFLRFDPTSELPHIVETEDGKPKARFACAGDLAIFASRDHKTLPVEYVRLYTGGQ